MEIHRTGCDVEGCKREDARGFHIFKEWKTDGAGSMENWYWRFDLCPEHMANCLDALLEIPESRADQLLASLKIKARVE